MNVDHYDLFNAPQYIDFNEFVKNDGMDNDNADQYFETHREEDDFFVPLENISPSLKSLNPTVSQSMGLQTPVKPDKNPIMLSPLISPNPVVTQTTIVPSKSGLKDITNTSNQIGELLVANKEKLIDVEPQERCPENELKEDYVVKSVEVPVAYHQEEKQIDTETQKCYPEVELQENDTDQSEEQQAELKENDVEQAKESKEEEGVVSKITTVEQVNIVAGSSIEQVKEIQIEQSTVESSGKSRDDVKSRSTPTLQKSVKPPSISISRKIPLPVKVTVPQPFNFSTMRQRKVSEPCKEIFSFKAKPVPLKVLQGDVVKVDRPAKTTQPVTIHFASDDRIRERQLRRSTPSAVVQADTERRARSNSITRPMTQRTPTKDIVQTLDAAAKAVQSGGSIKKSWCMPSERSRSPSIDRSKPLVIKPFSFEERDKEMLRKKDEKIRKAIEDDTKAKQFHAQPLPNFVAALKRLPKKHPAPPTNPEPFKLKSDQRGVNYQEEIKRKIEEEKYRCKVQAEFKAQPNEVIYMKPFEPEKSSVPLAEPVDLKLNTVLRANEREKFQQMIKEREVEIGELRRQEKMMKEEQEKKMTQVLRQLLVHKAKPAPKSRVFEVRASEKPLTDPRSPAFELLPSQRRPHITENKENH